MGHADPAVHRAQLDAPVEEEKEPAAQGEQAALPAADQVPAAQRTALAFVPAGHAVPAAHGKQSAALAEPCAAVVPGGHHLHSASALKEFCGHVKHAPLAMPTASGGLHAASAVADGDGEGDSDGDGDGDGVGSCNGVEVGVTVAQLVEITPDTPEYVTE